MMKAGNYYVGDLCYVMNDTEWKEFCNLTTRGNVCADGEFTFSDGRQFASYGTRYGDGTYMSNKNTEHCVDSGTIGCILVDDIKTHKYDHIADLGAFVTFENDFETSMNDSGDIIFGDLIIETA